MFLTSTRPKLQTDVSFIGVFKVLQNPMKKGRNLAAIFTMFLNKLDLGDGLAVHF